MSSPVRDLADRVFAYRQETDFYLRLRRGLPVLSLRVEDEAAWCEDAAFAQTILGELDRSTAQQEDDLLTAGFLRHVLTSWVDRSESSHLGFGVTPYGAYYVSMEMQQVLGGYTGSGDGYLSLLADLRDQVAAIRGRLLRQREAGVLLPRPAVPGARSSLQRLRALAEATLVAAAPSEAQERAQKLTEAELLPAFDDLLAELGDDYLAAAPETVGQVQWAGGEEGYRNAVRFNTASEMSPEQVHALGLEQVAALAEQMAERRAALGFTGSEDEFHAELRERMTPTRPDEVEALFLRHMAALEPLIGQWFSTLPKAPYGVERLDLALEAGMTYGYYEAPTSVQPIGRYRWNGGNLESKSMLTYAALIFHELAPGHHFHLARQAENEDLPDVRRESMDIGAFNEGWAEYAAGLGWEMGLYDDPYDGYGRLVHERFTAQRLVVDTGLNLMGWTLERAAEYMAANTTESPAQIASEVLRYSTDLPAQALAYRAGFVELQRIRANAEAALGSRFDVREFHERVLGPGALPFPTIEAHVSRWVAATA